MWVWVVVYEKGVDVDVVVDLDLGQHGWWEGELRGV